MGQGPLHCHLPCLQQPLLLQSHPRSHHRRLLARKIQVSARDLMIHPPFRVCQPFTGEVWGFEGFEELVMTVCSQQDHRLPVGRLCDRPRGEVGGSHSLCGKRRCAHVSYLQVIHALWGPTDNLIIIQDVGFDSEVKKQVKFRPLYLIYVAYKYHVNIHEREQRTRKSSAFVFLSASLQLFQCFLFVCVCALQCFIHGGPLTHSSRHRRNQTLRGSVWGGSVRRGPGKLLLLSVKTWKHSSSDHFYYLWTLNYENSKSGRFYEKEKGYW